MSRKTGLAILLLAVSYRGEWVFSNDDYPQRSIARIGRGSVPISKLTRNPSILLKSSLGSSCGPDPIRIEVESGRRLFRAQVYRLKRSCLVLDKVPQVSSLRINPA